MHPTFRKSSAEYRRISCSVAMPARAMIVAGARVAASVSWPRENALKKLRKSSLA
jgi:hypothetical protein